METDVQAIVEAKRRMLTKRQDRTPFSAVAALAAMQQRPRPVLNIVTGGASVTLIGHITLEEIYDPVAAALRYVRSGLDAVALFTDRTIYSRGTDDLLMVSRAVHRTPVISMNFILDSYQVLEARASGVSAVVIQSDLLPEDTLRETVSVAQRSKMSTIVQVTSEAALDRVLDLSPHALSVGHGLYFDRERDLPLVQAISRARPNHLRVMPRGCLRNRDDLVSVINAGVDGVIVDETLIATPRQMLEIRQLIGMPTPE